MPRYRQWTKFTRYGYVAVEAEDEQAASEEVYYMSDLEKAAGFVETGQWWDDAEELAESMDE